MCGIVGYIGKNNTKEILIDCLKKLEYRGYDSSGITLKGEKKLQTIKSIGKIKELEEKLKKTEIINANMGLAHTRWATHGIASEKNAHPHTVGRVTIVHNGIIENADKLRKKLESSGYIFKSETDTEVACAIIDKHYKNNPIEAIEKAMKELKGSYAFGIIFENINDKIFAVKKDSPLIVGKNKEGGFIASDITAIIKYVNKYILLEDNEIAEISKEKITIYKDQKILLKKEKKATTDIKETTKGKYKHYMIKEIMEEPIVLERMFKKYLNHMDKIFDVSKYKEIHLVACGSAMYAGMIGKHLLEEKANIKCYVECASEYRYKKVIYDKKTLVILISQSGETADTIAAMRKAKEEKIDTLAIVNNNTSTIAREAKHCLLIEAGPEIAVATTKAYLLQVAMLSLIALKAAYKKGLEPEYDNIIKETANIPQNLKKLLEDKKVFQNIAKNLKESSNVFYIGRGMDYAICEEGSLKLKEVSYTHSEAYQAGELKHGTISLIEKNTPVFAIITEDKIKDKTESNIKEVESRNANVYVITNDKTIKNHHLIYYIKKINPYFQSILAVPPLQLIGYYLADIRGLNIDKPRNLAKSVTVE